MFIVVLLMGIFAGGCASRAPVADDSQASPGAMAEACGDRAIASTSACSALFAGGPPAPDPQLAQRRRLRFELVREYVAPGGNRGAVATTRSSFNPEYDGWVWVRDSAIVMRPLVEALGSARDERERSELMRIVRDYVDFSRETQNRSGLKNLGEPRVDYQGRPYTGPWGRPQNDGPALRASILIPLALKLARSGRPEDQTLLRQLYAAEHFHDPQSIIKRDLEYIAQAFRQKSVDLWEEKRGFHFYTLMVQRAALVDGAMLARLMNDPGAAAHYEKGAADISTMLERHWDAARGFIVATVEPEAWRHNGSSYLDVASILGFLHGARDGLSFAPTDSRALATAIRLEKIFRPHFAINSVTTDGAGHRLGPAIGRYVEDVYNGSPDEAKRFTGGHPWVLATHALGEFYFKIATEFARVGRVDVNPTNRDFFEDLLQAPVALGETTSADPRFRQIERALRDKGESFWRRVRYHLPGVDHLPEMINGTTGRPQSIPSLAWSDASEISLIDAKVEAEKALAGRR